MVMMPLLSAMDSGVWVRTGIVRAGDTSRPLSEGDGGLPRMGMWYDL
jgi:hypothetical protein